MPFENLKIISISSLLEYENFDPVRTNKLLDKMPRDKVFINPIIAAKVPQSKKLVLIDGVNRTEALRKLGHKNVLAQIVNYFDEEEVVLLSNCHSLKINPKQFINDVKKSGLKLTATKGKPKNDQDDKKLIGWIEVDSGKYFSLGTHKDLEKTAAILNKLVNLYLGKAEIHRLSENKKPEKNYPIKIYFHHFAPKDIIKLARKKIYLNSGITRHLVNHYLLRINLPIALLKEKHEIANAKLEELIKNKMNKNEVRYFPSPTYLFDEWRKEHL